MPEPRPLRVFLCHANEDKPKVRELYRRLRADGIDVWFDEKSLLPGQDWRVEIPKAVRESDVVIVCMSSVSARKEGFVQAEINFALDKALEKPPGTIYIIPAKLEECDVPDTLSRWQWVNLFEDVESGYEMLMLSLKLRAKNLGASLSPLPKDELPYVSVAKPRVEVVKLPLKGSSPAAPANQRKLEVYTLAGLEFVLVPKGKFIMGGTANDNEEPKGKIAIPYDYWIGRFPVTNAQYHEFVQAVGAKHPVSDWSKKRDHPVTSVSWELSMSYCMWLNENFGHELPDGYTFHLPTEAEWEKAARGTDGREWPWGNVFDPTRSNCDGFSETTTPVGQFSPRGDSPYGCADMSGNVWEWCHSLYWPYPYKADDGREDETASGDRVQRGGSLSSERGFVRCAVRVGHYLNRVNLGFRVAASPVLS